MGCGLSTDGTLNGPLPRAHAVLLHDDGNALVTEAVAACQHCPLETGIYGTPLESIRKSKWELPKFRICCSKQTIHLNVATLTSCPRGRAQMGHGSGLRLSVALS